jgi:hypothetical protein
VREKEIMREGGRERKEGEKYMERDREREREKGGKDTGIGEDPL